MSTEVSRWSLRNFFLVGAFALQSGIMFYLYRKLKRIERECTEENGTVELRNELKALKTKLRTLELRINDTQQRTVTFAPTTTTITPQQTVPQSLSRVTSIASSEYVDALDDWPQTFAVESNDFPPDFSTVNIKELDELHAKGEHQVCFDTLKAALDQEPENTRVLWRLARAMYNLTSTMEKNSTRKNLIHEAHKYATDAYALLPTDFDVVKWCAITSGLVCEISGNKDRIKMGYEFKKYLDEALAMNAADSTLLHMRARFSYAISNLTYWERKAASLLFATPPTATIDEALEDFLAAETLKPNQWIDNLLYIGLCYLNKKDYSNAQTYLQKAIEIPPNDPNDESSIAEAKKMLKSIYK
ncbi:Regulator of microtubule dynamics protein 1 [Aphelenchoides besseyi]|nr:Regulator of microtubule dynamics protein 1 [Aphelenchoides besseyi]